MIEQLKTEIRDLERTLENKRDQLKRLMEDALFDQKKVLAIVEMNDQFSGITDIVLVDDNEQSIKKFEDAYASNFMISFKLYIFRIKDINYLKESYKDLTESRKSGYYGEDSIYEWIAEHQEQLINPEED